MQLYRQGNHVVFERKSGLLAWVPESRVDIQEAQDGKAVITVNPQTKTEETRVEHPTDIIDAYGMQPFTTVEHLTQHVFKGYDVNIQDQTTPSVIVPFNQVYHNTTLANPVAIDDRIVEISDATIAVTGDLLVIFSPVAVRFSTFRIVSLNGTTAIVDRPCDFNYIAGSFVSIGITNMAVNGSVTPQHFGIRGTGAPEGVELSYDCTRLIFTCLTDTAVDLAKFGDITALIEGLTIRKRDGVYHNILNWKNNGELAGLCYDWTPYSAQNAQQGQHGFVARLTFSGQTKIGVTQRLSLGEDLEVIISEDITGVDYLSIMTQGHIVELY
jgi:hypothetical protein